MSRFLVLAALAACVTTASPPPKPPDSRLTLEAWVGRWAEARTCLAAPAEDLATGVAIAMQSGRDCSRLLRRLVVEVRLSEQLQTLFALMAPLSRMIAHEQFSPSKRAAIIADVDKTAEALVALARDEVFGDVPWAQPR